MIIQLHIFSFRFIWKIKKYGYIGEEMHSRSIPMRTDQGCLWFFLPSSFVMDIVLFLVRLFPWWVSCWLVSNQMIIGVLDSYNLDRALSLHCCSCLISHSSFWKKLAELMIKALSACFFFSLMTASMWVVSTTANWLLTWLFAQNFDQLCRKDSSDRTEGFYLSEMGYFLKFILKYLQVKV